MSSAGSGDPQPPTAMVGRPAPPATEPFAPWAETERLTTVEGEAVTAETGSTGSSASGSSATGSPQAGSLDAGTGDHTPEAPDGLAPAGWRAAPLLVGGCLVIVGGAGFLDDTGVLPHRPWVVGLVVALVLAAVAITTTARRLLTTGDRCGHRCDQLPQVEQGRRPMRLLH